MSTTFLALGFLHRDFALALPFGDFDLSRFAFELLSGDFDLSRRELELALGLARLLPDMFVRSTVMNTDEELGDRK